jgi:hypothetical protein
MGIRLEVRFGATAPRLADQSIRAMIDKDDLGHFQRDADAIVRLHIRGLMTDEQADAARKKLLKRMEDKAEACDG